MMSSEISVTWVEGAPPPDLRVTQVYGFCFESDGRVLLIEDDGQFNLPGGKPEPGETHEETLRREALEEARITIRDIHLLGYQLGEHAPDDPTGSGYVQLRAVARIDRVLPPGPDPATGRTYGRVMCPPDELPRMLGWGEAQVRSACALARTIWAIEAVT